jgi:hypothetical protein
LVLVLVLVLAGSWELTALEQEEDANILRDYRRLSTR